jgi:hypothetical protein
VITTFSEFAQTLSDALVKANWTYTLFEGKPHWTHQSGLEVILAAGHSVHLHQGEDRTTLTTRKHNAVRAAQDVAEQVAGHLRRLTVRTRVCSWCHHANEAEKPGPMKCHYCGHRCDVSRINCDCLVCKALANEAYPRKE